MKDGSKVRLISRNQKDLTRDYPTVVAAIQTVRQPSIILDGEIVVPDGSRTAAAHAVEDVQ